jgi:cysteine synthase A
MRDIAQNLQNISQLVGNTPMFAIRCKFRGVERVIHAKAEYLNFTGSIKDRMALHILRHAHATGALKPGMHIVEATSGNTGIAFSAIGAAIGHPVRIYMPDWMSQERKDLIRSLGADVCLVSKEENGFLGSIASSEDFARQVGGFLPRQFANDANVQAHVLSTGPEIWTQLEMASVRLDAFVAGVGTGGTVMGVARFLRKIGSRAKVYPLEPLNSPTMSTGYRVGKHRIQGISDEFIPPIVKLDQLDEILAVDDGDAICMAQMLSRQLGIAVGISSGANFLGALLAQERLGHTATVATIFCDDNKKYLSTALMHQEPQKAGFLSPNVELLSFTCLPRAFSGDRHPLDSIANTKARLQVEMAAS